MSKSDCLCPISLWETQLKTRTGLLPCAHIHILLLIRWQVDTSSTAALYSHTMCNLELSWAPSSPFLGSSWPNKHAVIIIFSWICRSERGAHLPRPHAAGDRRPRTQALPGGSRPHGGAADTTVRAAAAVHVPGSSALRHTADTKLWRERRSRRPQDGKSSQVQGSALCVPHLIFALFGFIVCPFHYFHFSFFSPLF